MFTRTDTGLINKYLFYPEPIIWVEGYDDFPFYKPIVERLECRIEAAGGKTECRKLADAVFENDCPYVVVMDGDYDILENNANHHQRVLVLEKYAIENYFFERNLVQSICSKYLGSEEQSEKIGNSFDQLEINLQENLYNLVILDILNHRMDLGYEIFPAHADPFINIKTAHCISERIQAKYDTLRENFAPEDIDGLRNLVDSFLTNRRFSDLIRGHFIFGIIRYFIIGCVRKISGHKPNIDNESMLILLALDLWNVVPSNSHRELIDSLLQAVNNARELKSLVN
jgi:hypothetical protein